MSTRNRGARTPSRARQRGVYVRLVDRRPSTAGAGAGVNQVAVHRRGWSRNAGNNMAAKSPGTFISDRRRFGSNAEADAHDLRMLGEHPIGRAKSYRVATVARTVAALRATRRMNRGFVVVARVSDAALGI